MRRGMLKYKPVAADSLTARFWGAVLAAFLRMFPGGKGSVRAAASKDIQSGLSPAPDMNGREDLMQLMSNLPVVVGAVGGFVSAMTGAVVGASLGQPYGSAAIVWMGLFLVWPWLSLGLVLIVRSAINDRETRRWRKQGFPDGFEPSGGSQPCDLDFLYALPICVALCAFWIALVSAPTNGS